MLRYFLSDTIKALEDIRNAINFEPKNPFYHYALAYILIDKGELETVVNECNEALKYDKTFVDVLVMKGSALDQLKKSFEARKNYIKALQIDSTYEDIYIQFAVSYVITNNLHEAEGLIQRLLKQYPTSEDGLRYKAKLFMSQKKYMEAIAVADLLIKSNRSLTEEYLLKAAAYDSLKNQSKACDCMYQLLLKGFIDGYEYISEKCPPQQELSAYKIGTYQTKAVEEENKGNFNEAIRLFNEVIKLTPDSGSAYFNRGKVKRKMENHKAAIEDYLIAVKKSPNFSSAYLALGVSYTLLNDLENAKKYYLLCMQIDPMNEMAYYNFADVLAKNDNNYNEAIYYYKYAIDIKPDYTKAYYWLGKAYAKVEMNKEACEAFKMAEKLGDIKAISEKIWYCR
jgi:tetratricopeptide (TPR) repeat protein